MGVLKKAEKRAQDIMAKLGMGDKLKVDQKWITPPIPTHLMADTIDEESDDDDDIDPHNHTQDPFVVSNTNLSHLIDDVNTLHSKNLVSIEVKDKVQTMRRQMPFLKLYDDERGIATYKKMLLIVKNHHLLVPHL